MGRTVCGGVRAVAAALGAAAGAALLSGCAGPAGGPTAPPHQPLDTRSLTRTRTLDLAERLLERDCMQGRGFRFWVVPPAPDSAHREFPYAVDDIAWATAHGYGSDLLARARRDAAADPNQRYLLSLPPDRRTVLIAALNGPRPTGLTADLPGGVRVSHSDEGCTAEAERKLYGDLPAWFRATRVTAELTGERVAMVQRDPRFLSARARWAGCMKAAGLPYADPQQSRAAATEPERRPGTGATEPERSPGTATGPGPAASRAREIRVAVAEATCARSTGLSAVSASLDRSYGARLRRRYPRTYSDVARLSEAALPRARALIARG
ncbi:hypothetical protein [Streptomyces sp. NBC_01190]|uniref:hypothetical protein n=1 Tax=Streptomyces sp. NBC_01190 TaxID=2903767 RepID=UPI0038675DE2|nr:hypothetical protein OG519_30660 [Streptomyces sp. NBC_01190]